MEKRDGGTMRAVLFKEPEKKGGGVRAKINSTSSETNQQSQPVYNATSLALYKYSVNKNNITDLHCLSSYNGSSMN